MDDTKLDEQKSHKQNDCVDCQMNRQLEMTSDSDGNLSETDSDGEWGDGGDRVSSTATHI